MGIHLGLLQWQLQKHQRELKFSYLQQDENRHLLTSFTFTERQYENLDWEEPHEFKLNGEKYDVIEVLKQGDCLQLICYRDRAEEKLEKEIEQAIWALLGTESPQKDSKQKDSKDGVKFFISPSLSQWHEPTRAPQSATLKLSFYSMPSLYVESPPPQYRF